MSIPVPRTRPTFPSPLPRYLPRNATIPAAAPATHEIGSASAGQFSMSMKGMRRELRGRGVMTEVLVREVESEIMGWLDMGVWVDPDATKSSSDRQDTGVPIGSLGAIREVERTHMRLVWEISEDAFARYVVHCCARYHNVVSFSEFHLTTVSPVTEARYLQARTVPMEPHLQDVLHISCVLTSHVRITTPPSPRDKASTPRLSQISAPTLTLWVAQILAELMSTWKAP